MGGNQFSAKDRKAKGSAGRVPPGESFVVPMTPSRSLDQTSDVIAGLATMVTAKAVLQAEGTPLFALTIPGGPPNV
jgi:hypothetical protein